MQGTRYRRKEREAISTHTNTQKYSLPLYMYTTCTQYTQHVDTVVQRSREHTL